jgi:hypothetical protein
MGKIGQADITQRQEAKQKKRKRYYGFAATLATAEEEALAGLGKQQDGTKAVTCQKRVWRPQVKYEYQEIPTELDPSDDLD